MENIKGTGDPIPVSDDEEPTESRIDDISIAKEITEYMNVNRVNWAELEEANDMWAICDAISAAHSGLPDSLLKESFLFVLESNLSATSSGWNRQHLQKLLFIWKKEVQKIKQIERPTRFVAESFEYSKPVVVVKKRRRTNADKRKTQLQRLMGVGQMLEEARVKFATENGELDVEEDEDGLYKIGGEELSFETWGKINRITDYDIVHSNYIPPKQKRPRHKISKNRTQVLQNPTSNDKASTVSSLTNGNNDDFTSTENNIKKKVEDETKKNEKPTKQEKDEGELSESDDDDDSSSSSGSDDLQSASVARHRRKRRRENERQHGQTSVSNMNSMFQKFYQYRFKIMQSLSLQQKASFLEILKENKGQTSETRQQQITQFMGKFMEKKNGKLEDGAVVAPSEKKIDSVEIKQDKIKKSWWNCNKKCDQQQEGENQIIDVNLIQRDNHNLQTAINLTYEEIYGEPFYLHSFDAVWNLNAVIFNGVRTFFYKLFSLIVVIPLAIIFGIVFALFSVLSVFVCIPTGRIFSIPANWIFNLWSFIINGILDPVFHSIGRCFENVKISRYGINSDPTTILTA